MLQLEERSGAGEEEDLTQLELPRRELVASVFGDDFVEGVGHIAAREVFEDFLGFNHDELQ
jgi:hypothetical protein